MHNICIPISDEGFALEILFSKYVVIMEIMMKHIGGLVTVYMQ